MSRPVRPRDGDYSADVAALSRLAVAVKTDAQIPRSKRKAIVAKLDGLQDDLIEVTKATGATAA
jgi:hypothetical protein